MNQNMNTGCGCQNNNVCPPLEPIVMPCKTCTVTRCFPIEQPIICPTHLHRINRYVAVPRYYSTHTTSEETVCPGQAAQGFQGNTNQNINMNNFNM